MNEMRKCYISEIKEDSYKEGIRHSVCKSLSVEFEFEGKYYCVLHYPEINKHEYTNFNEVLELRLENQENDFLQVYFSDRLHLPDYKFTEDANFIGAKFKQKVFFGGAVFEKDALFGDTTFEDEAYFFNCTFNHLSFGGTIKGFAYFGSITVSDWCDFIDTIFGDGANFSDSNFHNNVFFSGSRFEKDALFSGIEFEDFVDFSGVVFSGNADFATSKFKSEVIFDGAEFQKDADFGSVIFKDFVSFVDKQEFVRNKESWRNFQNIRLADPKQISFHSISLRPSDFINIDSREFIFTNVRWFNTTNKFSAVDVKNELKIIKERGVDNSKELFKIACRQLAENAESNNHFEEASNFRRMAFETEWLEKKERISNWVKNLIPENEKLKRRFASYVVGESCNVEDKHNPPTNSFGILRRSGDFIIHGLYRITSFYGESWSWAASILLILILIIFPIIYMNTNFYVCPVELSNSNGNSVCETRALSLAESGRQSLATATLQNVETRKPNSPTSETFTILEKIFAPLQAALLALAIRRKFMR